MPRAEQKAHALKVMAWLGLFDEAEKIAQLRSTNQTALDALCDAMTKRMQYLDGYAPPLLPPSPSFLFSLVLMLLLCLASVICSS